MDVVSTKLDFQIRIIVITVILIENYLNQHINLTVLLNKLHEKYHCLVFEGLFRLFFRNPNSVEHSG